MSYVRVTIFIVSLRLTENAIQLSNNNTKSSTKVTQQAYEVSVLSSASPLLLGHHYSVSEATNYCGLLY